jgi:tetratricopeptide (TPR) repeat protein
VLNSLGGVLQRLGKFQEAAEALTKARDLEDRLGNERGQAMVLNSLGGVLQRLGKFQEAADALERSKTISEQMGDDRGHAMVSTAWAGCCSGSDELRRRTNPSPRV